MLLPDGETPRVVPFGLARGVKAAVDFRYDTAFYFGFYESELNPYVRELVRPGTTVFDIGGHRGWDCVAFARLSENPVVTFEVNEANIQFMERSFALNDFDIRIDHRFVGDSNDDNSVTIDAAVEDHFVPSFIKMDIEGAEAKALRGAESTMAQHKPSWIIEVHGLEVEQECLEILKDFAYETKVIDHSKRLLKEARGDVHNRWIVARP